jgi:hypothetical protein
VNLAALGLPPLPEIEHALRTTTDRLAREVVAPRDSAPRWTDIEWRIAMAVAVMHGVTVLLANRLRWRGPPIWQAFLAEQKAQSVLREGAILAVLARIDAAAGAAGIPLVGLKGAALLRLGVYAPGERPMADVDLLARSTDADRTGRLLERLGYIEEHAERRHRIYSDATAVPPAALGEHPDHPLKIELHTRIAERLPIAATDITNLEFPADAQPGLNGYPSIAALLRHLLLHAAGNLRMRSLRFIQLRDIALLSARCSAADRDELLTAGVGARGLWWALPPLALTAAYDPAAVAGWPLARLAAGCPWMLRRAARRQRLEDVSLTLARIPALPGIEWSASPVDALKVASSRLFPGRETRAKLRYVNETQPFASITPWYGRSQGARVARWLFTHPPRVQTLHAVRLALAYQPAQSPVHLAPSSA